MHEPADARLPEPGDDPTLDGGSSAAPPPTVEPLVAQPQAQSGGPGPGTPPTRLRRAFTGMRRWWRRPSFRWAVAIIVVLFILEYLLLPDIASVRASLSRIGHVNVIGLVIGLALEGVSLLAYSELTHTVLSPGAPARSKLIRINMAAMATSHVLPGGTAPGTALAYRLLNDEGVPSGTTAFGLATQGVGSAVVLNVIFWLALFVSIPLTGYNKFYGYAALVGLVLFAAFGGVIILLTRGQRRALDRLHRLAGRIPFVNADRVTALVQTIADRLQILLRDRALLVHALEWAAANWLFDAASLWVFLLAFGKAVSPIDLLVAYGLANILAVIPITPSGLGVVEGVLIPTLVGFHVTKVIAILGVLAWRLVNFWLPIPVGGGCYLSLRFGREAKVRRQERERHDTEQHGAEQHGAARTARRMRSTGPDAS